MVTREDYRDAVKAKYDSDKLADPSGALRDISRKGLKELCLIHVEKRRSDHPVFARYFRLKNNDDLARKIDNCPLDTLRPLESFMKGRTSNPDPTVIELLAVLVDFEPRPYGKFAGIGNATPDPNPVKLQEQASERGLVSDNHIPAPLGRENALVGNNLNDGTGGRKSQKTWLIIALVLTLITATVVYFNHNKEPQCMWWTGTHYSITECDAIVSGAVVARDNSLLHKMKKIHPTDTTTFFRNGEPVVWYSKQDNQIEFFSYFGKHPITGVTLKPVTRYIIAKYAP